MCDVLRVSSSGFYSWWKRDNSLKQKKNIELCAAITDAHSNSRGTYGSPRVFAEVKGLGIKCSRHTVAKKMVELNLRAKVKKKFKNTTDSKHNYAVVPNLLDRNFQVSEPNQAWVGDITYIWTDEGWLYLATVIELFSRRVIGWSMSDSLASDLALDALKMAVKQQRGILSTKLIFHYDRGVQYACDRFKNLLKMCSITQSMSRKGNCWDNAPAESFFHTLKVEHIFGQKFLTRAEAKASIFEWIEVFYNRSRLHSTLGYVAPADFEQMYFEKVS